MRYLLVSLTTAALALGALATVDTASAASKTKMGCIVGKQKWDATAGKCVDAKPVKKVVKKTKKPA